jgi:hypothetical protein
MAITLPTPGQSNWDDPLNDALTELQQDITAGANVYVSRVDADNLYARVNDSRITGALLKSDNLAAVTSKPAARVNLGLGNAAVKDVGTDNGTVAAGDALPIHIAATDPHGDRAWVSQNFIGLGGGTMSGALTIGAGGLTLSSGGLTISSGNIAHTGNVARTGDTSQTGKIATFNFSTTSPGFTAAVGGDAQDRFRILANGLIEWGDGTAARDTNLYRLAANVVATDDDLAINVAGKGLKIKEGSNAKMGTLTLVAGTATVNTSAVTANSRIILTVQTAGGTQGFLRISARSAGTSFAVTSTSATETSVVAWLLVEPA